MSSDSFPHPLIWPADGAHVARAAQALAGGALIGLPTETVYGLAADATSGLAVARIYEAKGRPSFNPLISHVADAAAAEAHGVFNDQALRLAETFWPGPLTLVVPIKPGSPVSDLARAGLATIALRVPSHPVALSLLRVFGKPVAAPSANRSGRISPTTARHVVDELGGAVIGVLDGGSCEVGVESTVVACLEDQAVLLRPGGISREEIERILGQPLAEADGTHLHRGPGMLASHYAPTVPLRMNARNLQPGEALLGFGDAVIEGQTMATRFIDLSPSGDLREAAAKLFFSLRTLDSSGCTGIAVAPVPGHGLGAAINDRLFRASAPRI
jgi:L-threonylcarbamoyladenylate synthase